MDPEDKDDGNVTDCFYGNVQKAVSYMCLKFPLK